MFLYYTVTVLRKDLWTIQDDNVRMYLLNGGSEAFLIDTGYGSGALRELVTGLISCPVTVLHTHSHGDHTGADRQFQQFAFHRADEAEIRPMCPEGAEIRYIQEGDVLRAGDAELEVLEIPGHTPGAVAFLERKHRELFSGDTFARKYPVYMQFPGQDMASYLLSMEKLNSIRDSYDRICPCHGTLEIGKEYIDKHIACCRSILDGSAVPGTAELSDGTPGRAAWYEDVAIFY